MLRARIAMRLKGNQQAARAQTFQRLERRHDFAGVMAVIIEQAKAGVGEQLLLASGGAAEWRDGPGDVRRWKSQLMQKRDNRGAIRQVLFTQQTGRKLPEALAVVPKVKRTVALRRAGRIGRRFRFHFDSIRCQRIESVGNRAGTLGEQPGQARIVRAKNQPAAGLLGERLEFAANRLEVGVVIEMFGIHVQDNGVIGLEFTQRTVAFISLDDEEWNLAHPPDTLSPADGGEGCGDGANRSAFVSS